MKTTINPISKISFLFMLIFISYSSYSQNGEWKAPAKYVDITSPIKGDAKAQAKGKKIYFQICANCHGRTGIGDGPGGKALDPQPADHTSDEVQKQSDGELFWKITNGRGEMPVYSQLLSKTQRWQVIEYIRLLNKE